MTETVNATHSKSVSVAIITRNEERYIGRCLQSLVWADEILVVDAQSADSTPKICQDQAQPWASKIRFLQKKWNGFNEQRTFAMNEAKHDWILVVDSDEICSPELAQKIRSLLSASDEPPARAFKVHRVEYFLGKPIQHGCWECQLSGSIFPPGRCSVRQ